jgi:hypothetical protein
MQHDSEQPHRDSDIGKDQELGLNVAADINGSVTTQIGFGRTHEVKNRGDNERYTHNPQRNDLDINGVQHERQCCRNRRLHQQASVAFADDDGSVEQASRYVHIVVA